MTGTAPYLVCKGRHPHQRRYGKSVSAHPEPRRHIRKQRKESCGSHYREDSPDTDDAHYLHRISIGLEEKMKNATHIAWATGGSLVPEAIREEYKNTYLEK